MLIMKKHNHETKLSGCMLISNRLSIVQIKSYGAAFHGRRKSYGLLSIESFSGFFGENGVDAFLGTLPISLIIIWMYSFFMLCIGVNVNSPSLIIAVLLQFLICEISCNPPLGVQSYYPFISLINEIYFSLRGSAGFAFLFFLVQ